MRIALGVEYEGGGFHGWQSQRDRGGVQDHLEAALAQVAAHPVTVVGAGRTDAGVHASAQVAHFDTGSRRSPRSWVLGANSHLPPTASVQWACEVTPQFHARYSALYRRYRYTLLCRPARSALYRDRAWWLHQRVDPSRLAAAASLLLGERDFSAFRAAACQAKRPWRHLQRVAVRADGEFVHLEFTANAFLHHMVRNVVGSLVRVATGEAEPGWIREVLASGDRRRAGMTAPAQGLTLIEVAYADHWGVPPAGASTR